MLHLHETIRVSHLVACPIVFFVMGKVGREECSKLG